LRPVILSRSSMRYGYRRDVNYVIRGNYARPVEFLF